MLTHEHTWQRRSEQCRKQSHVFQDMHINIEKHCTTDSLVKNQSGRKNRICARRQPGNMTYCMYKQRRQERKCTCDFSTSHCPHDDSVPPRPNKQIQGSPDVFILSALTQHGAMVIVEHKPPVYQCFPPIMYTRHSYCYSGLSIKRHLNHLDSVFQLD